jgi:hypothetical protein
MESLFGEAKLLRPNSPTNVGCKKVNTVARSRNDSQIGTPHTNDLQKTNTIRLAEPKSGGATWLLS